MKKNAATKPVVTTRSELAVGAKLRSGGGKHDTRPRGQRDRSGAKRAAIRQEW